MMHGCYRCSTQSETPGSVGGVRKSCEEELSQISQKLHLARIVNDRRGFFKLERDRFQR